MKMPTNIIPAIRQIKDFEKALESSSKWIIFLETRIGQLKSLVQYAKRKNKNVLIHIDLIQGLKADEYGVEYLVREVKPDGILSTRGSVVESVKKHKLIAIQRLFLLDSLSLENNVKISGRYKADYIEVLPGKMPEIIQDIHEKTDIPIIAGGLIKKKSEVHAALNAGAIAISTSCTDLW
ncbi:glycerol-3-phosphate responsive antiterminator [Pseudogracilibacillus auburnensis]|uniref:Glycerol uptake operon antiterminator regulatory protein n=1 Tax=Pseudogracilibacillus auburnensis TaxID=1494959 RepID=A0A2V3W032_9BACI|nr:glycerol-3-phosphate responsive antiterminator [Pseudogracilibacillus auburnensis]MBO1004095.1 glycerol-3-phosphate responsive antiterminator [Pseudogracilibacillus auburnensis]PXW85615.1 glycerol uptake operon antiterminator [Pseudogracilibacillus auburnensis]